MKALLKCSSYKSKSDSILNPINKFEHPGFQKSIFFNFTVGSCWCCCCAPRSAHFKLGNGVKCDCVTCNDNPNPGTPTSTLYIFNHFSKLIWKHHQASPHSFLICQSAGWLHFWNCFSCQVRAPTQSQNSKAKIK